MRVYMDRFITNTSTNTDAATLDYLRLGLPEVGGGGKQPGHLNRAAVFYGHHTEFQAQLAVRVVVKGRGLHFLVRHRGKQVHRHGLQLVQRLFSQHLVGKKTEEVKRSEKKKKEEEEEEDDC
jgi:hypothetical protein